MSKKSVQVRGARIPLAVWGAVLREAEVSRQPPGRLMSEAVANAFRPQGGDLQTAVEFEERRKRRLDQQREIRERTMKLLMDDEAA
ncbi:hypothetical protein [Lignipirellula cremea]|uniref:Uncharacterized protein n=1 Tax=Lignipirellula cremea TaxID=2528010 RepID=A0A518DSI6_9BACT|nr:hypothetical protein [Lignipirellula cremea]QDU94803.1 hypothetical protein Pla8534_26100 [Lignipirellula cremea]